jgi:hypothetical protein
VVRFLADYKRIFSSSKRPDWLRDLTSILYNRHRDVLSSMSERSELEANQFLSSTDEVKMSAVTVLIPLCAFVLCTMMRLHLHCPPHIATNKTIYISLIISLNSIVATFKGPSFNPLRQTNSLRKT